LLLGPAERVVAVDTAAESVHSRLIDTAAVGGEASDKECWLTGVHAHCVGM
jgi:hypothetical protein